MRMSISCICVFPVYIQTKLISSLFNVPKPNDVQQRIYVDQHHYQPEVYKQLNVAFINYLAALLRRHS